MKILRITTHWSAEEAEYVYQLLDEFKEAIWQSYGEDILEMHKIRQLEKQASDELEDFNDETPF
jgi:hypothetical protein